MDLDTFREEALPFGADASAIVHSASDDMGSTTVKTVAVFFDIRCAPSLRSRLQHRAAYLWLVRSWAWCCEVGVRLSSATCC